MPFSLALAMQLLVKNLQIHASYQCRGGENGVVMVGLPLELLCVFGPIATQGSCIKKIVLSYTCNQLATRR